ncbi:hypothetical protein [Flavobacterium sp. W22_SRS_FP1]|uniref:hypothetical protein n=1 Tax=Flavobacterium sp. W22_SRS_FP1 TaxID=3240276 RepID=UPI003F9121D6
MRKIILAILLFYYGSCFSQKLLNSFPLPLKKDKDVFQIVDKETHITTFFVSDNKKVKALLLDQNMQIKDSITTVSPKSSNYSNMIGYNKSNGNIRLFWASEDFKNIYAQSFNFKSKSIGGVTQQLPLLNEKVLGNFSENNKLYLLTIVEKTSMLRLYVFDENFIIKAYAIDLKERKFYDENFKLSPLYDNVLSPEFGNTQIVNLDVPSRLSGAANRRKIYSNKKEITIALDHNINFTQLIVIDLETLKTEVNLITMPFIEDSDPQNTKTNSFLFEDKIYQIKLTRKKMKIDLKDLNGTLIKEYMINDSIDLGLKNAKILKTGDDFGRDKIIEKPLQFLSEVYNKNLSINCVKYGIDSFVTFGAVPVINRSQSYHNFNLMSTMRQNMTPHNSMNMQMQIKNFGGRPGPSPQFTEQFIYLQKPFNPFSTPEEVYCSVILDREGNFLDRNTDDFIVNKLGAFYNSLQDISTETLFKVDNNYYLGYYDNKNKKYIIRNFAD